MYVVFIKCKRMFIMSYIFNSAVLGSMFAVPAQVVDNYIKFASASQLKTLLWICRHISEPIDAVRISQEIGYSTADVNDALTVIASWGVLIGTDVTVTPAPAAAEEPKTAEQPKQLEEITASKPSNEQIIARCKEDPEILAMFSDIEKMLGKTLGYDSRSILLMMHDHYGLPIEVIYMLVEYCKSVGKSGFSYISKVGKTWGEMEIDSIEKADEQIKILNSCNKLWKEFAEMAGIQNPRPSSSQSAYLKTWSIELKFNVEMIYLAYEEMLNHSSKISFPYMNKILINWHAKGIKTPDDIDKEKEDFRRKKSPRAKSDASYDIDEFNRRGDALPVYKKGS